MKVESFSIGSKHYNNEDRLVVQDMGEYGIVAVLADGMGGLSLGDLAAEVITKSVANYITTNYQGCQERSILLNALEHADKELRNVSITNKSNMGAAVSVVIVHGHHLYCIWQGNVRVYVQHDDKMNLVTEDHLADIGYGHTALTRCVKGAGLRDDVPYISCKFSNGDAVFICSDGFYNVADSQMADISIDEMKKQIGSPEDDASLIKIS